MFDVQSKSDDQLTSKTDHRKNEMKRNYSSRIIVRMKICACLTILFFSVRMMMIIVNSVIRLMVNPWWWWLFGSVQAHYIIVFILLLLSLKTRIYSGFMFGSVFFHLAYIHKILFEKKNSFRSHSIYPTTTNVFYSKDNNSSSHFFIFSTTLHRWFITKSVKQNRNRLDSQNQREREREQKEKKIWVPEFHWNFFFWIKFFRVRV